MPNARDIVGTHKCLLQNRNDTVFAYLLEFNTYIAQSSVEIREIQPHLSVYLIDCHPTSVLPFQLHLLDHLHIHIYTLIYVVFEYIIVKSVLTISGAPVLCQ